MVNGGQSIKYKNSKEQKNKVRKKKKKKEGVYFRSK
jgi:hypothetical protein